MRIRVTAEDIAAGVKCDPCSCPIALACKRAGIPGPAVTRRFIYIDNSRGNDRVETPSSAIAFITNFDAERLLEPFEFEIAYELPAVRA